MKSGIYTIRNKTNGNRYVGSAVNIKRRRDQHKSALRKSTHENGHLQRVWNKYGEDDFEFRVLFYCDPEMCIVFEQRAMDTLDPEYNIAPVAGSCLGVTHTAESRKNMSLAHMGYVVSEATKAKMSAAHKGKPTWIKGKKASPKTKAKISAALMGHEVSAEARANMSAWQKGRKKGPLSTEHKANIAAGMLGIKRGSMSAEHKAKLSAAGMGNTNAAANKGKRWSPARRAAQGEKIK